MTNQPEIVQPRVRRTGRSGNTPAMLAEQSTRVLICIPRLATTQAPTPANQTQPILIRAIQPQPLHIQPVSQPPLPPVAMPQTLQSQPPLPKQVPTYGTLGGLTGAKSHYSTTTEQLQGSPTPQRVPTAPPSAATPRPAARIDAAHTAAIGPHAAPKWLDERKGSKATSTRLLLVVGVVAGFALGALTWHGRGNHATVPQNSASRIRPSQASQEQPQAAAKVNEPAAAEFNLPAQVDEAATDKKHSGDSNRSTWNWNPKGAANSPASIDQGGNCVADTEPAAEPNPSQPADAPNSVAPIGDASRSAWLQGTIDNVHSTSAPVQR